MSFRIGQGYDIHQLIEGRALILGGVEIPFEYGLAGHSDADVLIHAIIDAMLGSLALGDIGTHFPPSDSTFKNIDSKILLAKARDLLHQEGYRIINIDSSIIAERPKLRPFIDKIRQSLSDVLQIDVSCLSVKAKTKEKMDAVGQGLAMEAQAVILVEKMN